MDDATAAASNARIVIMNPPFTNRTKMGEKFDKDTQQALRRRMDTLEGFLEGADPRLSEFLDKNSLRPRFAALADLCLNRKKGVFATVIPTTALTNTPGTARAARTRQTVPHPHDPHLPPSPRCGTKPAQRDQRKHRRAAASRSRRRPPPPRRPESISLDRLPADDTEADQLFDGLDGCETGTLPDGWGEVSLWPDERIAAGDWTSAMWRSPALADAAALFAGDDALRPLATVGLSGHSTGQQLSNGYACSTVGTPGAFPILDSKGVDVQQTIEGAPDEHWVWQRGGTALRSCPKLGTCSSRPASTCRPHA